MKMHCQFVFLVLGLAVVIAQNDEEIAITEATSTTTTEVATTESYSETSAVNEAACKELHKNSTDVTISNIDMFDGCSHVCFNPSAPLSLFEFHNTKDGTACGKDKSCYSGSCLNTAEVDICKQVSNGTEFTSVSSNECQVTCSNGLTTVASKYINDGYNCTPAAPIVNMKYECQDGQCVITEFRFPNMNPIIINPSRRPTEPSVPEEKMNLVHFF